MRRNWSSSTKEGLMRRTRWLALFSLLALVGVSSGGAASSGSALAAQPGPITKTPIKHLVVIFQENVSFDHYFGTYPFAANSDGHPFVGAPGTPAVDGLLPATASSLPSSMQHSNSFISTNPNLASPKRLDSTPTGL